MSFDPAEPLGNLADAQARIKAGYVIYHDQLVALVDGYEKMARAYKQQLWRQLNDGSKPKKKKTKR